MRQTTGIVESLLQLVGLEWEVPNFSTLSRRQKTLAVNIPYRGSQGPLHLLIDSTGIKVEGEWSEADQKTVRGTVFPLNGQARRVQTSVLAQGPHPLPGRRMAHSPRGGIDEKTLEIRAAELTTSDVGDAPMLPELLDQIPPDREIASVTAPSRGLRTNHCGTPDGAFDSRKCRGAAARGAAIIQSRKNAKPWRADTAGAIARNEALRASRRFGRAIWRRWSGYHGRSHPAVLPSGCSKSEPLA